MPGIRGAAGGGRRKRGRPPLRRHSGRHTTSDEVADQEAHHASDDNTDHDDTRRTRSTRKRPRSGRRSATPANEDSETKRRKEEAIKQEQAAYESEKDEDGEQKVDKEGRLQGGREYKVPTFTLPTRGDQVFMFAMEPARLLNYRDSYLFFHKNPELERARLTEDERNWLVDQRLLVHWFRNRDVAVVSARSCYKRFGHRVVKKGRRIIDDYFEARAREEGIPEGEEEESESAAADGMTSMGRRALISRSLRSSDYSANTPITNATWMHHAALAVRGFNAQLHERRAEKAGFYDIHTNIQQIAQSTQPTHCNFECVDSSSKKEFNVSDLQFEEKPASSVVRGIGSDLLDYDIEKVLESVADHDDTRELVKARIDALKVDLEPKPVDDDDKNYPIAVMDGQYQGSFPIHYTRFKQQDPKLAPPSALTSTAQSIIAQQHYFSQMYQIMNQSLASYNDQQPLHHHQQPMHHQPTPPQPPPPQPQHHTQTPPSAPIQPRPMMHHAQPSPPISSQPPSRQPILRVVPPVERRTCSVESCKQPVMFPGERCQLHASQTGTPPQHPIIQRGPPPATTYADNKCGECHYLSAPSEQLSKDGKDACDAFHMIKCAKCTRKYHPACVHLKTPRQVAAAESYPWACAECKICCVCKSAGDESKLMICDDCDRGWHTDCCNPPVENVPEGSWLCPLCADCHGCDEHGSDKEYKHAVVPPTADRNKYPIYLATFCNKCHDNFEHDRYCPVCLRTFSEEDDNDDEDNEMVACDQCDHWIHTGCDETLTPERYQALCDDEDAKYLCPLCADSVKPIHQTTAATMALKSQAPPSGVTVGIVGGKVRTRGIVRYKDHKIAAPEINGTGIAEMPSLSSK